MFVVGGQAHLGRCFELEQLSKQERICVVVGQIGVYRMYRLMM